MLTNGLTLMILGMGTVFSFLMIMVLVMQTVAYAIKQIGKVFPEIEGNEAGLGQKMDSNQEVAVAIAAVKAYLNK